jgi:hypothetical protein
MMEDPQHVGTRIARKIGSGKRVITPDRKTAVFIRLAYLFPYATGKLLARMTQKASGNAF